MLVCIALLSIRRENSEAAESKMWTSTAVAIPEHNAIKYTIQEDGRQVTFKEVVRGWKGSPEFREFYRKLLADAPFTAYFWETPAVTRACGDRLYEFVVVNSRRLANVGADHFTFRQHFAKAEADRGTVAFDNLGGTAGLIAPLPQASSANYAHLASFVRSAPSSQCHQFLQMVGSEFETSLGDRPVWLSTSGLGVYWLHARLDTVPKYYTYAPYKIFPVQ